MSERYDDLQSYPRRIPNQASDNNEENVSDPIERTRVHAAQMYPSADVRTKNHRGRPVVLAVEDDLIRIVKLVELSANKKRTSNPA